MAGAAVVSSVQIRTVAGDGPMMDAGALSRAIRPRDRFLPRASLVCLEDTHNAAGGLVVPVPGLRAMHDVARDAGCKVHLDGARLWNAAAATGDALTDFAQWADTVMVSFSKGLGAPAGAVLAGDDAVIGRANEFRKRLGGVMRQSGILAAAALYGLEHHLDRLSEDHARAADFAHVVDGAIAATVMPPETNIVMIDLAPGLEAASVARKAAREGVLVSVWTPTRIRVVLHLDIAEDEVQAAALALLDALDEAWRELGDTSDWPVVLSTPRSV
jgi:threonine aldolase